MIVHAIDMDPTCRVVTVTLRGGWTRQFVAGTFCPADVERFLADAEEYEARVRDCRAIFMTGGNVIPFPGATEPEVQ